MPTTPRKTLHVKPINNANTFYELTCEAVEPDDRERCAECGDLGPNGTLFVYSTTRGARVRVHAGKFCSRPCHDRWHGLLSRYR
jgi:hypothetical protein